MANLRVLEVFWQALPRQWPICRTRQLLLMTPLPMGRPGRTAKPQANVCFRQLLRCFEEGSLQHDRGQSRARDGTGMRNLGGAGHRIGLLWAVVQTGLPACCRQMAQGAQ